jgi:thiamine monophosphate synthase
LFPRLYAILDVSLVKSRGLEPAAVLDAWLDAGVRLIQLRAKNIDTGGFLALASDAADRCRFTAQLIVAPVMWRACRHAARHG